MNLGTYQATSLLFEIDGPVATLTLNRPERKNPITFESYAEMAAIFQAAVTDDTIRAFVVTGAGGNFCSGGDVHEIIGPLLDRDTKGLMAFTSLTGSLVKAMRACPQPIVAAVDGVAAGAGAIIAMASDLRLGSPKARVAFLFNRVGLAGCDMGRLRHPAAHHRPGTSLGATLHRTLTGGRGRPRLGLLQPDRAGRNAGRRRRHPGPGSRRGAVFRQCHDQTHAADGMGNVRRTGDRGRGCGSGPVHDNGRFPAGI
jgi:enoyl-CoA hydratase/carnithine racemase